MLVRKNYWLVKKVKFYMVNKWWIDAELAKKDRSQQVAGAEPPLYDGKQAPILPNAVNCVGGPSELGHDKGDVTLTHVMKQVLHTPDNTGLTTDVT